MKKTRTEKDSIGVKEVPSAAYYGIQSLRALENFPISGQRIDLELIRAYARIKLAAAKVNSSVGLLDKKRARAIEKAAIQVLAGKFDESFIVDVYQAGAGTSQHMNVNEVIANRANELLGSKKGAYKPVHPNDHVNMGQSTNDTYPTAMRIAILSRHKTELTPAIKGLIKALKAKSREFKNILTSGRTHLMDAVPIRLGQIFEAYADMVSRSLDWLDDAGKRLAELNIGGTAVGTGVNSHPRYAKLMTSELSKLTGMKLKSPKNLVASGQSMADLAAYSGALNILAVELGKIANDIRLRGSGPTTGIGELLLPAVQPGSSIMPGKVNPVMAEMLNMVCFQVRGMGETVSLAAAAGQFELNVMMPVISHNVLFPQKILANAVTAFTDRCIRGIKPNKARLKEHFERSMGLATILNPIIGYDNAAKVVKQSVTSGKTVIETIRELGILTDEEIKETFNPERITSPGLLKKQVW